MQEEITNIIRTFKAVGPILGNALKSGQLFNPQCELTEPDSDVLCEYDVEIPMSEGFSLTANIYRSKTAAEALQLIIAADEIIPSPPYKKSTDCNHGMQVLHFGGRYDSCLLVPKIPQ